MPKSCLLNRELQRRDRYGFTPYSEMLIEFFKFLPIKSDEPVKSRADG